ncbi:MAG: tetratricopeptide repeat protein [Candidatus Acidiferrales bacterium]
MLADLSSARSRWCFLFLVILTAGEFSLLAARVWVAERWNESSDPKKWLAAAQLEPGNAQYLEQVALYNELNLEQRDQPRAADYLQHATQIDPLSERPWLELAALDEARSDFPATRRAYEMAQLDFPVSPDVAWRFGNFLLRQGDLSGGFAALRRAIDKDPSLEASALAECWAVDPNTDLIAAAVLPRNAAHYVRAIRYFLLQKQTGAALGMWTQLLKLNQPIAMRDAIDLSDHLLDEGRISEAHQVWQEALRRSAWPDDANATSVLFNGGFEHDFLNGGFDWRELPLSGVSYDLDSSVLHSGHQSLRITFDGAANINFQHIFQYVYVAPHQRYRFLAYLRTEGISSENEIQFDIFDPHHPETLQISTPVLAGTNGWTPVRVDFESGADTQLLEILLRRAPGPAFTDQLRGTVWADDVSLTPVKRETMSGHSMTTQR